MSCDTAPAPSPVKQVTAQFVLLNAHWKPQHTLLIDTTGERASQVLRSAAVRQQGHVSWEGVTLALRQGAPGEDSTAHDAPPGDRPLDSWPLTLENTPPLRPLAQQQNQNVNYKSGYGSSPKQQSQASTGTYEEAQQMLRRAMTFDAGPGGGGAGAAGADGHGGAPDADVDEPAAPPTR